jgi:hypothetical protein
MDHEAMDEDKHNDDILEDLIMESLDKLLITKKVVAEELKGFYDLFPCERVQEILMFDLPYTAEEYEEYVREHDILNIVLPETPKEYEEYCEYVILCTFYELLVHIVGEKNEKAIRTDWEAIEDIRVRSLQRMFALYKE